MPIGARGPVVLDVEAARGELTEFGQRAGRCLSGDEFDAERESVDVTDDLAEQVTVVVGDEEPGRDRSTVPPAGERREGSGARGTCLARLRAVKEFDGYEPPPGSQQVREVMTMDTPGQCSMSTRAIVATAVDDSPPRRRAR